MISSDLLFSPLFVLVPISCSASANRVLPFIRLFPLGENSRCLFPSTFAIEQSIKRPTSFFFNSRLYLFPFSLHSNPLLFLTASLLKGSTPLSRILAPSSPKRIQELQPLCLSVMITCNFLPSPSILSSKDLESTENHLRSNKTISSRKLPPLSF